MCWSSSLSDFLALAAAELCSLVEVAHLTCVGDDIAVGQHKMQLGIIIMLPIQCSSAWQSL
jgi:hypothetical protein